MWYFVIVFTPLPDMLELYKFIKRYEFNDNMATKKNILIMFLIFKTKSTFKLKKYDVAYPIPLSG